MPYPRFLTGSTLHSAQTQFKYITEIVAVIKTRPARLDSSEMCSRENLAKLQQKEHINYVDVTQF